MNNLIAKHKTNRAKRNCKLSLLAPLLVSLSQVKPYLNAPSGLNKYLVKYCLFAPVKSMKNIII